MIACCRMIYVLIWGGLAHTPVRRFYQTDICGVKFRLSLGLTFGQCMLQFLRKLLSRHAADGKRQFFGGIFRLLYRSTIELQLNVGTHYLLEVLKLTALDTKLQKRGPFGSLWTLSSLANCIIYQRGITKKDLQNSSNFLAT